VRLAVVQLRDAPHDVAANLATSLRLLQEARDGGAELAVFPELALSGYYLDQETARAAAVANGALARLQAAVDALDLSTVYGLPLLDGGTLLNAVAVLRPSLEPQLYVKTHLYRREKDWFTPGMSLWSGELAGWRCGVLLCYEVGFPELARSLVVQGVRLLLVPAAFGRRRHHIWTTMTLARAMENGVYLAAAAHAGGNGKVEFEGHSRVVDPIGHVIAEEPEEQGIIYADLDASLIASIRAGRDDANDYLGDRRPELYGPVTGREGVPGLEEPA
jgi:predicted amidohydrolase